MSDIPRNGDGSNDLHARFIPLRQITNIIIKAGNNFLIILNKFPTIYVSDVLLLITYAT